MDQLLGGGSASHLHRHWLRLPSVSLSKTSTAQNLPSIDSSAFGCLHRIMHIFGSLFSNKILLSLLIYIFFL